MTLDGRDGAIGMTVVSRLLTGEIPSDLIQACKRSVFIIDNSFDDRVEDLIYQALDYFETATATSILPQTITLNYEYFKGKNKLPFGPVTITPIEGYTITGEYVDGGNGEALTVVFTAGNAVIPIQIQTLIARLFQVFWREDTEAKVPIGLQKQISKYRKRIE